MARGPQHEVLFEGFRFPIWAVVYTATAIQAGRTVLTTHHMIGEAGEISLPLFRTEEYAQVHITHRKLSGCDPAAISTPRELVDLLDGFRTKGECDVRFDDAYGPTPGTICYPVEGLIQFIRDQYPEA